MISAPRFFICPELPMRTARQNLRKVWSDKARAAALAARRGEPAGGGSTPGETLDQAKDKANAYIAAHPNDFLPKGTKKPKGKGAGKAKDPKAEAAKAKEKAAREAEHAQRQKEHTEDRAQHQADRAQRAKEHAQSQSEHAQSRAEHEQDRAQRQKQQAERAKQQAAKAKSKASAGKKSGGGSKSSSTRDTGKADAKAQEATARQGRLNTAAASRVGAALASGGKVNSGDASRLIGAGLARQNGANLELTTEGQGLLSQKMAKRRRARAWEAEMLSKAELPELAQNAEQSLQKYL